MGEAIHRPDWVRIVDSDSHITEPPDVWTARVPKKYIDQVPRVDPHPETGHSHWHIGQHWLMPAAGLSHAGWKEHFPRLPREYAECEPGTYDAAERLKRLDDFGIDAQVLYPNIVGFYAALFQGLGPELSVMCVKAYNDFIVEWCSEDANRLVPVAMLPFWDIKASVAEIERCADLGVHAVLFANKFERMGLPSFVDPSWDPIYDAAQSCEASINYHIGFANLEEKFSAEELELRRATADQTDIGPRLAREAALNGAISLSAQCNLIGQIIMSGLCDRFPRLRLVSVESGFGQMPFFLEFLDWHWLGSGMKSELLPSEYFARQCYGTFWFELTTLPLLQVYPDNFMFSTDYPHPASLSPGPCGHTTKLPWEWVADAFGKMDPTVRAKALYENAASLYRIKP